MLKYGHVPDDVPEAVELDVPTQLEPAASDPDARNLMRKPIGYMGRVTLAVQQLRKRWRGVTLVTVIKHGAYDVTVKYSRNEWGDNWIASPTRREDDEQGKLEPGSGAGESGESYPF